MSIEAVYVLFRSQAPDSEPKLVGLYLDRADAEQGAHKLSERGCDAEQVSISEGRLSDPEFRALIDAYASARIPKFEKTSQERRFHRLSVKLRLGSQASIVWRPSRAARLVSVGWLLPLATFPLWTDGIARVLGLVGLLAVAYGAAIAWSNTHSIQLEGQALVFRSRPVPFPGATRAVETAELATAWLRHVVVQRRFDSETRLVHVADEPLAAAIAYEINRRWFPRSVLTLLWTQHMQRLPDAARN